MAEIEMTITNHQIDDIKRAAAAFESHSLYRIATNIAAQRQYEFEVARDQASILPDGYRYFAMADKAATFEAVVDLIAELWNMDVEDVKDDVNAIIERMDERD